MAARGAADGGGSSNGKKPRTPPVRVGVSPCISCTADGTADRLIDGDLSLLVATMHSRGLDA